MLLDGKQTIIYGAAGGIGAGVAHAYAREGATVHLVGRTQSTLEQLAKEIRAGGGDATVAVLDVLDRAAVDQQLERVASTAGHVDVSFNLASRGDVQGTPFVDLSVDDFLRPTINGLTGAFNTASAAARVMTQQGSGVIISLTSASSKHATPMMGGTGAADGAVEAFMRHLAAEVSPVGVRVVGIHTAGVAETLSNRSIAEVTAGGGPTGDQLREIISNLALLPKGPQLADVANTAVFLASDHAAGITASIVNVTCGISIG